MAIGGPWTPEIERLQDEEQGELRVDTAKTIEFNGAGAGTIAKKVEQGGGLSALNTIDILVHFSGRVEQTARLIEAMRDELRATRADSMEINRKLAASEAETRAMRGQLREMQETLEALRPKRGRK